MDPVNVYNKLYSDIGQTMHMLCQGKNQILSLNLETYKIVIVYSFIFFFFTLCHFILFLISNNSITCLFIFFEFNT